MFRPLRSVRACALLALALPLVTSPSAQSPQDNDKAAAAAVKNKTLPLTTTRTMTFTTSEGTWMSLGLSPDGQRIVFELLGDLYTMPVTGGEAARITSGPAYDMQPQFSPDGKRLVFISDRNGSENIWIANADGTNARALTATERDNYMSPIWTPDGEYVIAAKGSQLWMYHETGVGSGVQMTGSAGTPAAGAGGPGAVAAPPLLGPVFAHDPRYLWVNVRGAVPSGFNTGIADTARLEDESSAHFDPHEPTRSSAREQGQYQIAQLDRETGRPIRLTT